MAAGWIAGGLALVAGAARADPPAADLAAAFAARPAVSQVSLSPDGSRVAFVAPLPGQGSALYVVGTGDGAQPKRVAVANDDPERLAECHWGDNRRLVCLIYGQQKQPDATGPGKLVGHPFESLVSLSADGGDGVHPARQVTLGPGLVVDWLSDVPDTILVRDWGLRQANIVTGKDRRVELGVRGDIVTDGLGRPRIAEEPVVQYQTGRLRGIVTLCYRDRDGAGWHGLGDYQWIAHEGFAPLAVDPVADLAWGYRKVNGRYAVETMTLDGKRTETQVYARPDVDVDRLVRIGRRQRIVGVSYVTDALHFHYTDPALAALAGQLAQALPKTPIIRIVDASDDERKLLILAASDVDPGNYYVLDRDAKRLRIMMEVRPQLDGITLAAMKPVSFPAADGTSIPAYLTLPPGNAKPGRAIVLPHGGPSARDEWGFDWLAQYYAARGYAVLQPNYRGSAGYGQDWLDEQGFVQWRIAVSDIDAGARWLVAQGIADPRELAIVGWSYGGYAALQAAAVDPTLYRAVVAVAPVTDLSLVKGVVARGFGRFEASRFIGTDTSGDASPVTNAGKIAVPVMLVHGTFDLNAPYDHSRRMEAHLAAAGHAPRLVTFVGLDHQLDDAGARQTLLDESDAFLRAAMRP